MHFKSSVLPVKPLFLNISLHLDGDQIPHRLPLFNQLPDLGRGDIEKRNFFEIEPIAWEMDPGFLFRGISKVWDQGLWEWRERSVFLRSRSGHHNKVAKGKEILKFLPRLYLYKGIPSQDEERGFLMSLPEEPDGIDGVRFSRPWEFQVTGGKVRVVCGS